MYKKVSIRKQTAAPLAKSDLVILIDVKDIASDIDREFGNTRTGASVILVEGAKAVSIQANRTSISAGYDLSGEIGSRVFSDRVEFDYPGENRTFYNIVKTVSRTGVVVIIQSSDGGAKIYGSKHNPLLLTLAPVDNGEGCRTHLTFTQRTGDAYVPRFYAGSIPDIWDEIWECCGDWMGAKRWVGSALWD